MASLNMRSIAQKPKAPSKAPAAASGDEAEGGGEHGRKRAESRPAMGVERHDAPGEQRGRDAEPGIGVVENRMGIEGQLQ